MRKKTLPDIPPADLYWLAGLLEGEGSFLKPPPSSPASPRVAVEMTDRDVVERVGRVLGAIAQPMPDRNNPRWKPTYRALIGGERAADLMRLLHPLMGLRRQAQILQTPYGMKGASSGMSPSQRDGNTLTGNVGGKVLGEAILSGSTKLPSTNVEKTDSGAAPKPWPVSDPN